MQDGWHNYIFLSRSDPYKYILKVELKLVISGRVDATRCSKLTGGMPPVPPTLTRGLIKQRVLKRKRKIYKFLTIKIQNSSFNDNDEEDAELASEFEKSPKLYISGIITNKYSNALELAIPSQRISCTGDFS